MEILASIFIFLVLVVDGILPKANLAKSIGVLPEENPNVLSATANVNPTKEVENTTVAGKKLEFKEKVKEIKDAKKRVTVQTIDENITKDNEKWMNYLTNVLNRLSAILEKIKIKTDEAEAQGKDITKVREGITEAQTAIAEAQTAVNEERDKTYTITLGDESNLGQGVSTTVREFRSEVNSVFEKVKTARQAVRDTLSSLKTVLGEGN